MSQTVIEIRNLSKMYRLGQVGTGTLSHDLNRWWHTVRGKEDPFLKLGQENKRDKAGGEYVWALKDVNFDVQQGEVLGIIGKNGAGKSTLLKLLSRVTAPTTGTFKAKGRIASLLEVGTGFHPELTGRENIFLNGAILGMSKQEIKRKFDEIVDFAGVERYIDTPVKRYSSGMYVRLAFGVAAHLESEILIVDEVLAVGDAEFQSKCLGKMNEVSKGEGRTVLFVSHNMGSVKQLCNQAVLMKHGTIVSTGASPDVIEEYLSGDTDIDRFQNWSGNERPGDSSIRLDAIRVVDERGSLENSITTETPVTIQVDYEVLDTVKDVRIVANLLTVEGGEVFSISDYRYQNSSRTREPGRYRSFVTIPGSLLNAIRYIVSVDIEIPGSKSIVNGQNVSFTVDELIVNEMGTLKRLRPPGVIHPVFTWTIETKNPI